MGNHQTHIPHREIIKKTKIIVSLLSKDKQVEVQTLRIRHNPLLSPITHNDGVTSEQTLFALDQQEALLEGRQHSCPR